MAPSRFSPSTRLHSAALVRQLASLDIAPVGESAQSFAEGLSDWVAWTDAIALSRVLADAQNMSQPNTAAAPVANRAQQVIEQVARVRKDLAESIVHDALLRHDGDERDSPSERPASSGGSLDHAACRRQYRAHQHTMEDRIGRLRADVRSVMSGLSPNLRRLAALDAVLDIALAGHQRRLLDKVPQMLEKRIKTMQATPDQETKLKHPHPHTRPSDRARTWRECLLAELELRMQPVQGMVDTLGREATWAST